MMEHREDHFTFYHSHKSLQQVAEILHIIGKIIDEMQRYLVTMHDQNKSNVTTYPVQMVGYKLTFAENGRAPELAGSIWTRMAKCDDPITKG